MEHLLGVHCMIFYFNVSITVLRNNLLSSFTENDIEIRPNEVRALPLAAGRNVGGHHKWHFFLFSLSLSSGSLLILPEGVVVGIQIFAWAPN